MNDTTFEGNISLFNLSQPIRNIISEKGNDYLVRTAGSILTINDAKVVDPVSYTHLTLPTKREV